MTSNHMTPEQNDRLKQAKAPEMMQAIRPGIPSIERILCMGKRAPGMEHYEEILSSQPNEWFHAVSMDEDEVACGVEGEEILVDVSCIEEAVASINEAEDFAGGCLVARERRDCRPPCLRRME